ncbi:MAG: iron-sulfur cluster-binding protein, partial [Deltaproteobacteria bacterium]|nr:iron-sulfur cluster-binding protein [Deltaproteobacteria bacterium]
MSEIFIGNYKSEARKALKNQVLQGALADLQNRFGRGTALAYQNLPEGPDLRLKAHEIRKKAVENLDVLLETLAENVRKNGGHVFFAEDSQAA